MEGRPDARQVVIDEIQRVPDLLNVVHQLIEVDRRPPVQFILTGSSARKLKRSGVNLLAGRLALKTMHPFMAAELGSRFDLERSLEVGMLLLALRSYAALYVREEVQAEGREDAGQDLGHPVRRARTSWPDCGPGPPSCDRPPSGRRQVPGADPG